MFFPHHRANVVHTDLKPANLVLGQRPERLVVVDFGSALVAEKATARPDGDGTTPAYAAPELWTEPAPDFRADLFSLSVVAFELLTGKLPYEGLGGRIGHPEFRPAGNVNCERPSEHLVRPTNLPRAFLQRLDRVVLEGLRLDRQNRYPSPSAFRTAWGELAKSLDAAKSPGLLGRALDWFRRWRR
jgi:serine/threonine protein kinase